MSAHDVFFVQSPVRGALHKKCMMSGSPASTVAILDFLCKAVFVWALHKKYIVGAHRAPLQLRTQAVGVVYDRPGFFVQSRTRG